jgi:hypothetical protein
MNELLHNLNLSNNSKMSKISYELFQGLVEHDDQQSGTQLPNGITKLSSEATQVYDQWQ